MSEQLPGFEPTRKEAYQPEPFESLEQLVETSSEAKLIDDPDNLLEETTSPELEKLLTDHDDTQDPTKVAERKMLVEKTQQIFQKYLKEREIEILNLRFGLKDGKARTLEEVGNTVGLTRERVRQIEARALSKLRHVPAENPFEGYGPSYPWNPRWEQQAKENRDYNDKAERIADIHEKARKDREAGQQ